MINDIRNEDEYWEIFSSNDLYINDGETIEMCVRALVLLTKRIKQIEQRLDKNEEYVAEQND